MLSLYQVKPTFQNCLRPFVSQLAQWHMTPNQVTIAAIALSLSMGGAIALAPTASWPLLLLPVILLGRLALNAIDGMLAREHQLTTSLGSLLNELGDLVSDCALYLPFCLIPHIAAPWVVGVVILALLTEFVGVLGLAIAQHRPYDGPLGKSDRALVFGLLGLSLGWGCAPGNWLTGFLASVCVLEGWTVVNRIQSTLKEVSPCP